MNLLAHLKFKKVLNIQVRNILPVSFMLHGIGKGGIRWLTIPTTNPVGAYAPDISATREQVVRPHEGSVMRRFANATDASTTWILAFIDACIRSRTDQTRRTDQE